MRLWVIVPTLSVHLPACVLALRLLAARGTAQQLIGRRPFLQRLQLLSSQSCRNRGSHSSLPLPHILSLPLLGAVRD